MKSISWNMQDVAPAQRFAYWREAVCETYLPLEPAQLSGGCFDGRLDSTMGHALKLSHVTTVAASIRRTAGGIRRFQDGSFFANLQLAGEAIVEQYGQSMLARPGDIVLVDTDAPFAIHFTQGCDLICATIPGERLRRQLDRMTAQQACVIAGRGAGRLVAAYMSALGELSDDFDLVDDLAADQLATLLLRATAVNPPAVVPRRAAADLLPRILGLIADELHNPLLSAKYVCRKLEISRSHLFAVLAEAGITFAAHIRTERLRRSFEQLSDPRFFDLSISEIGRRWGFASPETFSRAFRKTYGKPPAARRATAMSSGR